MLIAPVRCAAGRSSAGTAAFPWPRREQPRRAPHDSAGAGSAEGRPERADLCSIR